VGDLLSTTSRPAVTRDFALWAATAAWCVLAYVVAAACFFLLTRANTDWGSPEWGSVAVGPVAIVAHSALGFAAGRHLPSRFTAPLFAIAMYWVQGLALFGLASWTGYLSPLGSEIASTVFYDESPDTVVLPQIIWFLGLAAVALSSVAVGRQRTTASWITLAVAAVVAVVPAVVLTRTPVEAVNARGTPVPYEPACEEGEILVCVHPAYEMALPGTMEVVDDLVAPLVDVPGAPSRAEQRPEDPRIRPDGTLVYSLYGAFHLLNANTGYGFRDYMEQDLAHALVAGPSGRIPWEAGAYGAGGSCRKPEGPRGEAQRVVAGWLIFRTGNYDSTHSMAFMEATNGELCPASEDAIERFDALEAAEWQAWLRKNYAALRAGELTLEDLP